MSDQVYYAIRSKTDGSYLVAHPRASDSQFAYLLLFSEDYDALSYLNTHAQAVSSKFGVELISTTQLSELKRRWGFTGIGIVQDPLLPRIEFLSYA